MKFFAIVLACGIYHNSNRICLEWTDQKWYASRAQCIARGKSITKDIMTFTRFAGIKLEKYPVPSCKEK